MSESTRGQGKEAVRLCQHIVRQAFGNVICRVATVLLNRGRLPLPTLSRLAGLPVPTTSSALLILMQHNLVQTTCMALTQGEASSSTATGEDQYEFDVGECLYRLRLGRVLNMTAAWPGFGKAASIAEDIVRLVILYGRLRIGSIPTMLGNASDGQRANAVHEALVLLVRNRFLIPTCAQLQIIKSELVDRRFAIRKDIEQKATVGKLLSAPKIQELRRAAWEDVEVDRENMIALDNILTKRPNLSKSRRKADDAMDYDLDTTAYLRLNHDRYGILIRDEILTTAATDKWNVGAGIIMRAVLDASLDADSLLRDAITRNRVSFGDINGRIPDHADAELRRGLLGSEKKDVKDIVKQYLDIMAGKDSLFANNGAFLDEQISGDNVLYSVAVERVCVTVREQLLAQMVRQKLDQKAARVLAVVTKARIASEQTVRDCAMLPLKDARIYLSRLQKLSLIETTEVPKVAAKRIAGATGMDYHLWSVDLPRVYNNQLSILYKTMANCLQRQASEVEKRAVALEKEEKAVSQGNDRSVLNQKDRDDLVELEEIRRKLVLAVERCDTVAFIIGELPGWPQVAR